MLASPTPKRSSNAVVLAARIQSRTVQRGRVVPFSFTNCSSLKQLLGISIGLAFAGDILQEGLAEFTSWDALTVFQEGREVPLSTSLQSLRTDSPLVCVISEDQSLPANLICGPIEESWEEQRQLKEVDEFASKIAERLRLGLSSTITSAVPTSQERHWIPANSVLALKRFFFSAVSEISARLKANSAYPEVGLTSELVYSVFAENRRQDFLKDLLRPNGIRLEIACEESGSAERVFGSDLGFCISIIGQGLTLRRAILCQAKRLHPERGSFSASSRYGDLMESDGRSQAQKMLSITPCSYFLLYNPSDLRSIVARSPRSFEALDSLDYADDGILVLPAAFVAGASGRSLQTVTHLLPFTSSFVKFMVDDYVQGKLGDAGRRAVSASMTRDMRRAAEIGDLETPAPRFSVGFTIDISEMHADHTIQ